MNNNYGLVYPDENDYYDINVFNQNFSSLADAIDKNKGAGGSRGEIIVAAYNSKNKLRDSADHTCTRDDCSDIIKQATQEAGEGGTVLLLDGDFYVNKTIEITDSVRLKGLGMYCTRLQVANIFSAVDLNTSKAYIQDMGFFCCDGVEMNSMAIEVSQAFNVIENCHFHMNYSTSEDTVAAIYIDANGYNIIRSCFFEQPEGRYMINSPKYNMRGMIYGNYAEQIDSDNSIAIKINLKDRTSYDNMSFGAQKSEIYINSNPVQ